VAREGGVLLGRDVLVAEEEDLELDQRRLDLLRDGRRQGLRQIEAGDLGTETRARSPGVEMLEAERIEALPGLLDVAAGTEVKGRGGRHGSIPVGWMGWERPARA
jgi:hypothetical protein